MAESAEARYLYGSGPQRKNVRRRPTLPRGPPRSTIGAEGLNFRVRNGTGCFPFAMATETLWRCVDRTGQDEILARHGTDRTSGTAQWTRNITKNVEAKPLGLLVPVSSTPCSASTSGLSTQSSSWGPYRVNPEGDLILRRASRLDAFSGYPFRTQQTSRALGRTTGTPEVRPSRSSRTRDSPSQVSYARSG